MTYLPFLVVVVVVVVLLPLIALPLLLSPYPPTCAFKVFLSCSLSASPLPSSFTPSLAIPL